MKNKKVLKTVYAALFAALIFAGTQFIKVPLPFGYFNLGDCFVLLCAVIVGGPYALTAAAVGSVLADVISGYAAYVPATLIIKPLVAFVVLIAVRLGNNKKIRIRFVILSAGIVLAEILMVGGYFAYDCILYGTAGATAAVVGNIIQGVCAVITSLIIITVFEHSGLMKHIKL